MSPSIDVATEIVLDGVVAAVQFSVVRRRSWTDKNGIEHHSRKTIGPLFGSLYPGGKNDYVREDADQLMGKDLEIVTRFRLRSVAETRGGVQWQPDLIRWNGGLFLVDTVRDFTVYGPGFVYCAASSFDYTGAPPRGSQVKVGWMNFGQGKYSGNIGAARCRM